MRSYFAASGVGVLSRLVSVLCRFASVPIMLRLLDPERYGLWLVISSFLSWLALADFGLPTAMQSPLVAAIARKENRQAQEMLHYGYRRLTISGLLALLVLLFGLAFVPIGQWFHVSIGHRSEFLLAIGLSGIVFAIGLPFRLTPILAYAANFGYIPPLTDILVQLGSVLSLWIVLQLKWRSLLIPIIATNLLQIMVMAVIFRWLLTRLGWRGFRSTPILPESQRKQLTIHGTAFLAIVIGEGLVLQTDTFLIGVVKQASAIASFAIPAIFWMQFLQLQNVFLRPLWPHIAAECSAGNRARLRLLVWKGLMLSIGSAVLYSAGLVLFGNWAIVKWTHGSVVLPRTMAWGFAFYVCAAAPDNFLALYCNAAGFVNRRLLAILIFGPMKLLAGWWWLAHESESVQRLPLAYAVVLSLTDLPLLGFFVWRQLRTPDHTTFVEEVPSAPA